MTQQTFLTVRPGINGEPVVSARELHAYVQGRYTFESWIKENIANLQLEKGKDYQQLKCISNGKEDIDYSISLDAAKEITMVLKTKKGKEARTYLLNCEKQLDGIAKEVAVDPVLEFIKKQLTHIIQQVASVKSDVQVQRKDLLELQHVTFRTSKRLENNAFWPEVNNQL